MEMFHQARRTSMWLRSVLSRVSAPGLQRDSGDLLPMTLSYVMTLLRQHISFGFSGIVISTPGQSTDILPAHWISLSLDKLARF